MKILFYIVLLFMTSCAIAPKGKYPEVFIDRPYTTGVDVAKATLMPGYRRADIERTSKGTILNEGTETLESPRLIIQGENGWTEDFSVLFFPLGFKWTPWKSADKKHNIGITAEALVFINLKLDYWFNISEKLSLRPYVEYFLIDIIIKREEHTGGIELVYQWNKKLALLPRIFLTSWEESGAFDFLNDLFSTDQRDYTLSGKTVGFGLRANYSLNDHWDLASDMSFGSANGEFKKVDRSEVDVLSYNANIGFTYFW